MTNPVIKAVNISKTYGRLRAVDKVSFSVLPKTCCGFLGPNGAGKTTLMKMIYARALRDRDKDSSMDVFGYDPQKDELTVKNMSGVISQEDTLDEDLNVIQNLYLYSRFYAMQAKDAERRTEELLEFLELSDKRYSLIRELSGGMKRRLVIARALLNQPQLLILDEPTTGLDPQVRHLIWDKLRDLKRNGTTMVLTTHYMEEAFQLSDRVIIMHEGKNIMQGVPAELVEKQVEKYVLEIPEADIKSFSETAALPADTRSEQGGNMLRLYSQQLETLKDVSRRFEGNGCILRETNLEDVFLKATGRMINERQ